MNALVEKFKNLVPHVFSYLENQYGFKRLDFRQTTPNAEDILITLTYLKENIFLQIELTTWSSLNNKKACGDLKVIFGDNDDRKISTDPSHQQIELDHFFYLEDLVDFRTQGEQECIADPMNDPDETNLEIYLQQYAKALKSFGTDIMSGDLSVIEDLYIIRKNRLKQNIK